MKLPDLHENQKKIVMPRTEKYGVFSCGTKFGKTLGFSIKAASLLLNSKRPREMLWAAPYYQNAKVGFNYIKRLLPQGTFIDNKSSLTITMIHNQTSIVFKGMNANPEAVEGNRYHHVFIDEASKMVKQAIASIRTTTTQTGAYTDIFSTPRGRGWFYEYYMRGSDTHNPDYTCHNFRTIDNPFLNPKEIEIAKRELPERLFRQYYLAEFIDDGEIFIGFRSCVEGEPVNSLGQTRYWLAPNEKDHDVVIGVDWAKKQDYTVFTAIKVGGDVPRMVGYERFQGLSYIEAIKRLRDFGSKFKSVRDIYHDKTGVGEALDDIAGYLPWAVNGVLFTNSSKNTMVNRLIMRFERKAIVLPNITEMINELEAFEVSVTPTGKMTYSAPAGKHDDIVSALMLAVTCYEENTGNLEIRFLEEMPPATDEDKFYEDLFS